MGKRAYISDGVEWIPLVSSIPNLDAYATTEYVDENLNNIDLSSAINTASAAAVAYLVDSAPGALDTLNELAAALGDDENFATTVTNSLSNKLDISSASVTYATIENLNEKPSTGKAIAMAIVFGG